MRSRGNKLGIIGRLGLMSLSLIGCGSIANSTNTINLLPATVKTIPQVATTYDEAIKNITNDSERRLTEYEGDLRGKIDEYHQKIVERSEELIRLEKERIKSLEKYTEDFKKVVKEIEESQGRF